MMLSKMQAAKSYESESRLRAQESEEKVSVPVAMFECLCRKY